MYTAKKRVEDEKRKGICKSAKRAGDYYMFDYDPSTDELVKPVESFVPEVTPGATNFDKLDPGQISVGICCNRQSTLDLAKALQQVQEAEKIKDSEERMIEAMQTDQKARQSRPSSPPMQTALEPTPKPSDKGEKGFQAFMVPSLIIFTISYESVEIV
ncbi:hypothetical protein COOONC_15917 [Cooperia oncophora]